MKLLSLPLLKFMIPYTSLAHSAYEMSQFTGEATRTPKNFVQERW